MAVKPERHLHPAADVAIIAPAEFDHLVAQDRVGNQVTTRSSMLSLLNSPAPGGCIAVVADRRLWS